MTRKIAPVTPLQPRVDRNKAEPMLRIAVVTDHQPTSRIPIHDEVARRPGVANELAVDGENGFVCKLDVQAWAERVALMHADTALYKRFSRRSLAFVRNQQRRRK